MSMQPAGIRRRTVVRSAAWTAPAVVMVMAAPAHASTSSTCQPLARTIDWGSLTYTRESSTAGTYTLPDPDGTGLQQGLTFSRPVTDLRFTICDIDSAIDDFQDGVGLSGAAFTGQIADSSRVAGTGSTSDPFHALGMNAPVTDTSTAGNVTVTMASVTAFSLHYWNGTDASAKKVDGDQGMFLSDFTFMYAPC